MTSFITKKDGAKIAFDSEKIKESLVAACIDAELSKEEADKISVEVLNLVLDSLKDQEQIPTTELRDKILAELDMLHPVVAEAWRRYEVTKVIE